MGCRLMLPGCRQSCDQTTATQSWWGRSAEVQFNSAVFFIFICIGVIVNSSNTMATIIWLTLSCRWSSHAVRVQRRRAVVTICDTVVEAGVCKDVVTTLSYFLLLGPCESHVSISFSCIQTGAALNPGWISRLPPSPPGGGPARQVGLSEDAVGSDCVKVCCSTKTDNCVSVIGNPWLSWKENLRELLAAASACMWCVLP